MAFGVILRLKRITFRTPLQENINFLLRTFSLLHLADYNGHGVWILRLHRVSPRDVGELDVRAENALGSTERSWTLDMQEEKEKSDSSKRATGALVRAECVDVVDGAMEVERKVRSKNI